MPNLAFILITGTTVVGLIVALVTVFTALLSDPAFSQSTGVDTVQSRPVEGDPANFDPIASFGVMQGFAGEGAQLVEFEVDFVRSDGTLDLTATYSPGPRVTAEFVIETDPPADAPPLGAGGGGTWYSEIKIEAYEINHTSVVTSGESTYTYTNRGMIRDIDSPSRLTPTILQPPICPLAALWRVALAQGAPAEAVATVDYDEDGYEFRIRDVGLSLMFGHDCEPRAEPLDD